MTMVIEEQLKHCAYCDKQTRHMRNNVKSSGFAIFIHVILTLLTVGIWLIPLVLYKLILMMFTGSWKCSECESNEKNSIVGLVFLAVLSILVVVLVFMPSSLWVILI